MDQFLTLNLDQFLTLKPQILDQFLTLQHIYIYNLSLPASLTSFCVKSPLLHKQVQNKDVCACMLERPYSSGISQRIFLRAARLQNEVGTTLCFWRHEFSHKKMLQNLPEILEPYLVSPKNPTKFSPNFPQNVLLENQKKSPTSFCRSAGRKLFSCKFVLHAESPAIKFDSSSVCMQFRQLGAEVKSVDLPRNGLRESTRGSCGHWEQTTYVGPTFKKLIQQ